MPSSSGSLNDVTMPGPGWVRRFDLWAAGYDASQLQTVLYGPAHEAVLRYVRRHVVEPTRILDVGCGTGRLASGLEAVFQGAELVGVDMSAGMIRRASVRRDPSAFFVVGCAEAMPFAGGVFGLVVVTLSVSHWWDAVAGLGEVRRVMAPGAVLVAAEAVTVPGARQGVMRAWRGKRTQWGGLPSLIAGSGLRVRCVQPVRPVAFAVDAVLVAAERPC
jgi:ubiquinone/menaquinone biosynthesis C-methylase UbiE